MTFSPAPVPAAAADDATLVARYMAGDDAAFAPLLLRHQGRVFTLLLLIVRNRSLAEDLTQEAFIKVIRKLQAGEYHETGKFGSWVGSIAHRVALDALRRRKRKNAFSLDVTLHSLDGEPLLARFADNLPDAAPTPDMLLQQQDEREYMRRYIEELPAYQKQVLLMRHYGQLSFQEIAVATGVSTNTAVSRLRRALHNLRSRLAPVSTGASLLLATLLAMPPITRPLTFALTSANAHDQNLYPRDADPVRV